MSVENRTPARRRAVVGAGRPPTAGDGGTRTEPTGITTHAHAVRLAPRPHL
ncbi:hypothetical protein ACFYY8_19415 [Streptosporangium sp. NPDC001559]|uniref:hypothetical protein n=1 Tax=Streptosporangium sp. NPDC001559 TaxID=3366187 RepID=UPI0036E1D68B